MAAIRDGTFLTTCHAGSDWVTFGGKADGEEWVRLSASGMSEVGLDHVAILARLLIGEDIPAVYEAAKESTKP